MFVPGTTVAAIGSTPAESGNSSQPTVATLAPATAADGITIDSTGSNKCDSGDRVAGGSTILVLLMQRIEEIKSNLTRALLEGNIPQQMEMAKHLTTLGKTAVILRKLKSMEEISDC